MPPGRDQKATRLHVQLTGFAPRAPDPEVVLRMETLLRRRGAFDRDHFEPGHFTASAFVIDPSRERLLLIHHGKLELWLQPGGHVEPGDEDLMAAARRELREETGLERVSPLDDAILDLDIHDIPARGPAPAHQHFDVRFGFASGSDQLTPASDAKDARWVPFDALAGMDTDASVRRTARRLMALR